MSGLEYKTKLKPRWLDPSIDVIAGTMGGFAGRIIEFPFDTIKVRLQTSRTTTPVQYVMSILRKEGIRPLYNGLPLPLVGAMLEAACMFSAVGELKLELYGTKKTSVMQTGVVAGLAGIVTATVLTPIELVKCRLQVPQSPYKNTLDCLVSSIKKEGPSVLFNGYSATLVREIPGTALWFMTYEQSLKFFSSFNKDHSNKASPTSLQVIASGAMSGIAFWAGLFPSDTIKTRLQTDSNLNVPRAMQTIFKENGIRGFYRGVTPTIIRSVPGTAAVFYCYESMSGLLHKGAEYCF